MKRLSYEYVRDYINARNCTLLSTEYKNNKTELKIRCNNCGRIFYMRFNNFKDAKHRCICYSKPLKLTYEYVKEYINNSTPLMVWCGNSNHKPFEVKFNNFKDNESRCPHCKTNSKGEIKIKEILNDLNISFIQ